MTDEFLLEEKAKLLQDSVNFTHQKREFQTNRLSKLLHQKPNSGTIAGMANLAGQAQVDLYTTDGINRGDTGRRISNANVEMGARVVATLLDRTNINPSYEVGNINAWLRSKGLETQSTVHDDVVWTQGKLSHLAGEVETNHYFSQSDVTVGADATIFDLLALKCSEMAQKHAENPNDVKVLNLASAVATTLSMEISSLATTGQALPKEIYKATLETPLKDFGIQMSDL